MSECVQVPSGCYICGKDYPVEDMRRLEGPSNTRGGYHVCKDCDVQYLEKWPDKKKEPK